MKEKTADWLTFAASDIAAVKNWFQPDIDLRVILTLDNLYLNSRYPGDFGLLPDGIPSRTEILAFFESSKGIYNAVSKLLI